MCSAHGKRPLLQSGRLRTARDGPPRCLASSGLCPRHRWREILLADLRTLGQAVWLKQKSINKHVNFYRDLLNWNMFLIGQWYERVFLGGWEVGANYRHWKAETTGHGFHLWGTSCPPGLQKVRKWPFSPLEMMYSMYEQNSASKNGWWIYWHGPHASQGVPTCWCLIWGLLETRRFQCAPIDALLLKSSSTTKKDPFPSESPLNYYWTTIEQQMILGLYPQTPISIYHHLPSSIIFQVSAFQGVDSTSMDRWLLQVLPSNAAQGPRSSPFEAHGTDGGVGKYWFLEDG